MTRAMPIPFQRAWGTTLIAVTLAAPALAGPLQSGEQVYHEVCQTCHATGLSGAPKYGDEVNWDHLIEEGQEVLTAHGWVGVRAMPPKGGKWDLSLEEFGRAVAFMARAGGADWQDPDAEMLVRIEAEIAKRRAQLQAGPAAE